jgi:hypothetical protein
MRAKGLREQARTGQAEVAFFCAWLSEFMLQVIGNSADTLRAVSAITRSRPH